MQEVEVRLRRLERHDWWLWAAAIFVMLLLTLAILALSFPALLKEEHPFFHSGLQQAVVGLLALVVLFSSYAIYQLTVIKRLRGRLAEQIVAGSRQQSEAEELQRRAMLDPLTGLYNEKFLHQHLATEVARSQRHDYPLNVAMIDLNHFQQINEQNGRQAGDLVLKEFTDRLKKSIRSSDLLVRIGGDEFLVLLPESSPGRVPHMLSRLSGLEVDFSGQKIPVTFACGWTTCEPSETPEHLLERLSQEVVSDKRTGRAEEAIRQAQEEARQMQNIEALARLAGKVAHDFNNLVGLVKGYSELVLDRLDQSDPLREYLEQIHRASEGANSLTRQLLAFRRKAVLAPAVLDLNTVIADMETMLRRMIGQDIDLVTELDPALGRVKLDRGQIEQVLLNLAVYARDTMPRGGALTLQTGNVDLDEAYAHWHPGARPGSYVLLAVRDTGVGMDADTRAHIFEPFFITKEKPKGTGLGLAAVYGIVKQTGGYIWVDSEAGRGTTFSVYLPRISDKTN